MTKRQAEFHALLRPHVPDVLAAARLELAHRPVGFSMVVAFAYRPAPKMDAQVWWLSPQPLRVMVTKVPEGFVYAEHLPGFFARKGRTMPPCRPLR